MKKMEKIYYSSKGYWKGLSAIKKLSLEAGVSDEEAKDWLSKQALWQIYKSPPNYVPRPHWTISEPNEIHQADLLFLPHDKVGRKTYKYALVVIDIASRYADAEGLTSKSSEEVSLAFKKIYSRKLKWPKTLIVDPGREFMGSLTTLMNQNKVIVRRSEASNHRAQAFVERANRTLGEKIFSQQYADEFVAGDRSTKWVNRLPNIIKTINNHVTRLTGKKAIDAYRENHVNQQSERYSRPVGFDEKRLDSDFNVRYLLSPGEEEGGSVRRATDPIWSTKVFELKKSVISKNQPVLYYLVDGPRRGFVREELQVIPEDTELLPKFVLKQ